MDCGFSELIYSHFGRSQELKNNDQLVLTKGTAAVEASTATVCNKTYDQSQYVISRLFFEFCMRGLMRPDDLSTNTRNMLFPGLV